VGDSRFYHLQNGRVVNQTKDHSVPQVLADAGDIRPREIRGHEDRNRLLRTLGMEGEVKPTVLKDPLAYGDQDLFLLCSDGFWELVDETEMEVDYTKARDLSDWLAKMEDKIITRGKGEYDNYTALALRPMHTGRRTVAARQKPGKQPAVRLWQILLGGALGLILAWFAVTFATGLAKKQPHAELGPRTVKNHEVQKQSQHAQPASETIKKPEEAQASPRPVPDPPVSQPHRVETQNQAEPPRSFQIEMVKVAGEDAVKPFFMSRDEVREPLWNRVMESVPFHKRDLKTSWDFIKKLNELTGRSYRLPKKQEWDSASKEPGFSKVKKPLLDGETGGQNNKHIRLVSDSDPEAANNGGLQ
jgi:hypothetical protein